MVKTLKTTRWCTLLAIVKSKEIWIRRSVTPNLAWARAFDPRIASKFSVPTRESWSRQAASVPWHWRACCSYVYWHRIGALLVQSYKLSWFHGKNHSFARASTICRWQMKWQETKVLVLNNNFVFFSSRKKGNSNRQIQKKCYGLKLPNRLIRPPAIRRRWRPNSNGNISQMPRLG